MIIRQGFSGSASAIALIFAGIMLGTAPSYAEEKSAQQIIDGLKITRTRSISEPARLPLSADDRAFVKRVRGLKRSLSMDDRNQMDALVTKRPTIDLDVNFDYDSAALTPKVEPQLNSLGRALAASELSGSIVMLGGHTDGKGGDQYNQGLSERRAETVKRFLVDHYHIPAENLVTAGYGKQGMKNPNDPFAAENRRVQISNVEGRDEATR